MNIPIEKVPMVLIGESAKNDLAALVQKYDGFPTYVIEGALMNALVEVHKKKQKEIEQAYNILMIDSQEKDESGGE